MIWTLSPVTPPSLLLSLLSVSRQAPPRRPPSPMTGRPLKAADLIPLDMMRETPPASAASASSARGQSVKFMCPVSR